MFKKFILISSIILLSNSVFSQTTFIGKDWEIGIGGGIVRFEDKDSRFIGDKHLSQIPRFNVTHRVHKQFAIDAAVSFGSSDSSTRIIAINYVPYFSFDLSGRYTYFNRLKSLDPYIFVGGSIIDSDPDRKITPTINAGTGLTYWISDIIGINAQLYYKHSLKTFEDDMRSHLQFTGGIIFGLNSRSSNRNGSTRCYYDQLK